MISFVINITLFIFQCTFHVKQNISINFFFSEGRPFHQEATLTDRVESNGNSFGIENLYIRSGKQWIISGNLTKKKKTLPSTVPLQNLINNCPITFFLSFLWLKQADDTYLWANLFLHTLIVNRSFVLNFANEHIFYIFILYRYFLSDNFKFHSEMLIT